MGLLGIMLTVHHLLADHDSMQGSLRVCCDGKSALERVKAIQPILITEPHTDLLSAIQKVKNGLQCQLSFIHVCGHQDAGITQSWSGMPP